jgi:hypothetical protein
MRAGYGTTAAALYALLALLALGALLLFLMPPPQVSWSLITSTPGLALLVGTVSSLGIVSAALAAALLRPMKFSATALRTLALALPAVALGWNVLAPLFWLVPVFFVWRATATA